MKSVDSNLETYLNTVKEIQCCDLYEFTVGETKYYYTNSDRDIVYNSQTYKHNVFLFERDQIKLENQLQVDSLTVTVSAGESDTIAVNGTEKPFLKAVNDGDFDGATLKLSRCFFKPITDTALPAIVGVIALFSGVCDISQAGGLYVQFSVKSKTTGLNMTFPMRRYYPQGAYSVVNGSVAASDSSDNCLIAPYIPRKEVLI